ncbi:hypothetical protein AB0K09_00645 [Streptomyces sp. NPDC049577]|uniref:hypothetical protein n=1 Tax=Streptomyces sp. NPDC049577 TaxID=3155153 RepID=UPI003449C2C5
MVELRVERLRLDADVPMMYRDSGRLVRMAYDPEQIDEAAALALLYARVPRLVAELGLCRSGR